MLLLMAPSAESLAALRNKVFVNLCDTSMHDVPFKA